MSHVFSVGQVQNFKSIIDKIDKVVIPGTTKEIDIRTCEVKLC